MLGSLDPILIFQIYKKVTTTTTAEKPKIPLISDITAALKSTIAVIPIYLSEQITGIYIDNESKNIDIDTNVESLASGEAAIINQKALGSVTTVNMVAKQGSIGLTILLALAEQILDKATSQEYEVTYMHGAVTVFGGLVHGFSYEQGGNDDLIKIKLEISRGRPKAKSVNVPGGDGTQERLANQGSIPPPNATTAPAPTAGVGRGSSVIQPGNGVRINRGL